ncbi:TraB/GumN family protein [Cohnella hongkongensis]|uniref:TraB/GumN family protein n=1 Tax=Cohnella hongkongensis TaxID=178337 RepID=A0ABV9F6J9_9BACL
MSRRLTRYAVAVLLAVSLIAMTACSSAVDNAPMPPASSAPEASASSAADSSSPSPEPPPAPSRGFLWKIEGGAHPGYLAGTIHIAEKSMYPLDPKLEQALEEADFVALELDLTKVDQRRTLELVNERALLPEGTTLQDLVDEKDYERFQSVVKKSLLAGAAPMLEKYEPWYAAMTLESLPALRFMMTDGIDQYLAKQARREGKTIVELESLESQLDVFDGMSDELQRLYFHQTVNNSGQALEGMRELIGMWRQGDLDSLEATHEQFESEGRASMGELFDEYNEALLLKRNSDMADKVDRYLRDGEEGTYLIAVGSLHMVGESGLVSLLEQKGYEVEFVQ